MADSGDSVLSDKARELNCETCGDAFLFTALEQEAYGKQGWSPPRRCPGCRDARRRSRVEDEAPAGGFEAICSACGALTHLSFQPTDECSVYCEICFKNR